MVKSVGQRKENRLWADKPGFKLQVWYLLAVQIEMG